MSSSLLDGQIHLNLTYPMLPFNTTSIANFSGPSDTVAVRHHDGASAILAGLLVPHLVCTLVILARVWSRLRLLCKWFLDDTLIVAAWLFSTGVCAVYCAAAVSPAIHRAVGLGAHTVVKPYAVRVYLGLVFYQLCLCLSKLSILAFYLRLLQSRPLERRLARATVVFVLLYGVPLLLISVLQCQPTAGQFFGHRASFCLAFEPLLIASASLHAATDAWLVVLVAPCIARLEIPPRQKTILGLVLSLSVLVMAAGLTRLQLSLRVGYRPGGGGGAGANRRELAFFVMTILECDIAIICASAPTLRPVLAGIWPRLVGEQQPAGGRRRRLAEDGSVDLTSVVSYHGYPWTRPSTPMLRSKNGSLADAQQSCLPVPPVPAAVSLAHRTPTTLSLRSFMSSMAPRSRGVTLTGRGDRVNLLRNGDDGEAERRRSSVGFEGYHEQYLGYGEFVPGDRHSIALAPDAVGQGKWSDSQESFVDPMSPYRLSPVSGFSGTTYAVMPDADDANEDDGEASGSGLEKIGGPGR
ncbi:Integral membrane protein [Pleurostoma richardsiae]|uniref:Integral membrane protein n=1 Tax=Pleurostoma richardsiae TaxID=41990 RepID=A0AA38VDJ7_9PEZI|nr:Integral membrane protein [Pleurostoma richardsiae]